jgi:hypothetical protein
VNWQRYRETQGNWQCEVVLAFDPADKADPFIEFRSNQYRKTGKLVRLLTLRTEPSGRQRNGQ